MDNNQKRKSLKSVLLYVTVIVVSALLLIIGNRIATTNLGCSVKSLHRILRQG